MEPITKKDRPVARSSVVLREEFDDWAVLFDPDSGITFGLRPIGVFIWERLDGQHTVHDIISDVHECFSTVSKEASAHVKQFVEELVKQGLATQRPQEEYDLQPSGISCIPKKVTCDDTPAQGRVGRKVIRTPRSLDLAITNKCNLRCEYCSHFGGPGDVEKEVPLGEWLLFFEELRRCSVMSVTLQGGEPFYRDDLKAIVQSVVSNGIRFGILSNGTLVTDEMAAFLADTGRCDEVQVSIDGSIPAIHDSFRGKGNFQKAIQGIERLKHYNLSVSVRVTIHKENVRDLDGIAELLLEKIGLSGFSTNSASHMGLCRHNKERVQLTAEERSLAMESLLQLNRKYDGAIGASAGPLADAKMWCIMERVRQNKDTSTPGGGCLSACNGPMEKMAVRADGVMVPCMLLSHMELGRINEHNLKTVWQSHLELERLRKRSTIPLSDFAFCRDCPYTNHCTGNCPALAYTTFGQENHPSPDACLRRFLEEGGRLPEPIRSFHP